MNDLVSALPLSCLLSGSEVAGRRLLLTLCPLRVGLRLVLQGWLSCWWSAQVETAVSSYDDVRVVVQVLCVGCGVV